MAEVPVGQRVPQFVNQDREKKYRNNDQQRHACVQSEFGSKLDGALPKHDWDRKEKWVNTNGKSKQIEIDIVLSLIWFFKKQVKVPGAKVVCVFGC